MGAGRLKPSSPYDLGRLVWLQPPSPTADHEPEAPAPPRPVAPSSFLCPIHLDIMADPVTLHTGITYDRTSIQTWLIAAGQNTCPVTNQPLRHQSLIPNHALRRAIHTWCKANPWPTTKPLNLADLTTLFHELLDNIYRDRYTDRHIDRDSEFALQRLAAVLPHLAEGQKQALFGDSNLPNATLASHLSFLLSSETRSSFIAKVNAAEILHALCEFDPAHVTAHPDAIAGLTHLLRNEDTPTKDSLLKCLFSLCRYNPKNRVVAVVDCQAVSSVLKLMIPGTDTSNPRMVQICCGILESLANCAEGREAIREHPVGVASVVESLLGVSDVATGYAVGALWGVVALAADRRSVMQVAVQAGVVNMLLMVMSSECSAKAKAMAKEVLKLVNEVCGSGDDARSGYYVAAAEVGLLRRRHQSSKKK